MAISPKDTYPGQIDTSDPAYPLGKARNVTTPGDGSGTPFEQALVNDIFGFQQALLDAAGVVASNDPDEVGASQYLEALTKHTRAVAPVREPAPSVVIAVPASAFVVDGDAAEYSREPGGLGGLTSNPGIVRTTSGTPDVHAWCPLNRLVPATAEITRVRAQAIYDATSGISRIQMKLETYWGSYDDWESSLIENYDATLDLDEVDTGVTRRVVLDSGVVGPFAMYTSPQLYGNIGSRTLHMRLQGVGQIFYGVEITYTDHSLTNT